MQSVGALWSNPLARSGDRREQGCPQAVNRRPAVKFLAWLGDRRE